MAGRAVPQPGQRPSRRRRLRTPLLILLAALIAATLMVALSARAVVTRSSCSQHPLVVTVAVAPDLAPAVRRVGRYYNSQHHDIGGRCARIAVTAQAPGTVAAELSGRSAPAGPGGSGSASPAPSATAG
ncbi:MAG: hypothetical protein J2P33_02890, partial [Actinobacteria bacterium]|nr:hypothetical protein [Actinomycetota bacterium]